MNNAIKKTLRIITVVGARPQFIKAAVVSKAIQCHNDTVNAEKIKEDIIHTGQHYDYDMSEVFFEKMQIPRPSMNLNINLCDHGEMTGKMIAALEKIFKKQDPDWVMVYGDTNSTLAGSLAAVKLHIPVAHVEAGLRSFNKRMPEEINRVLTDRISNLLLCPSKKAVENLLSEGLGKEDKASVNPETSFDKPPKVTMVGDVMYDSFLMWQKMVAKQDVLRGFSLPPSFILATIHRQENTDDSKKLRLLIQTLGDIGKRLLPVIMPLHPRAKRRIEEYGINIPEGMSALPPLSYDQMIALLDRCILVITDSGGLQKEAYFAEKCCITLRDQTEWVETVTSGTNLIAGNDPRLILSGVDDFLYDNHVRTFPPLYGQGDAAKKVVKALLEY